MKTYYLKMQSIKTLFFILIPFLSVLAQIVPQDFIGDFESGNIANVQQAGVDSFTFEIRLDDQHGDTYGWYYFAIINNIGRTVTLFLTNPDNWQNSSCNPVVSINNREWERVSDIWGQNGMVVFRQELYGDTVWFAQCFPFTMTRMYSYLDSLADSPHVLLETLGFSVNDRPIKMITITDEARPDQYKKTAWLISRQHPMETPPSFLLTGLIDKALDESDFSYHWKRDIVLKIVPIINVDGVVEGYSRHNVNGINLNREWQENFDNEEPEVRAVHEAINEYFYSGNSIDFFMDLHAAPEYYDFGFRISQSYSDQPYYSNQSTFIYLLENFDPWQDYDSWRNIDTTYASGVASVALYDMYDLDSYSSENPWTRRYNNDFIDINTLYEQGADWAMAIYNYLYPLTVTDTTNMQLDSIIIGQSFVPKIWDFDERYTDSLITLIVCEQTNDTETVILYPEDNYGRFLPENPFPTEGSPGVPGDNIISLEEGGEMQIIYTEPDMQSRIYRRILDVFTFTDIANIRNKNNWYLSNAYPNPFNSKTTILYKLPQLSNVTIDIYNLLGQKVTTLVDEYQPAGSHKCHWDAAGVLSGIYFYKIHADSHSETGKMLLLR